MAPFRYKMYYFMSTTVFTNKEKVIGRCFEKLFWCWKYLEDLPPLFKKKQVGVLHTYNFSKLADIILVFPSALSSAKSLHLFPNHIVFHKRKF